MRILVVDDMMVQSRVLGRLLSTYGVCDFAGDGLEAVAAVFKAMEEKKPYQLICLDINMPRMDGHEALRRIREAEKKLNIPADQRAKIVMTTAQNDPQNVMAAMQGECNGYILKPLSPDALFHKLKELGFSKPEVEAAESPAEPAQETKS